jgi:hypothetical protein
MSLSVKRALSAAVAGIVAAACSQTPTAKTPSQSSGSGAAGSGDAGGAGSNGTDRTDDADQEKHCCRGLNECKGKGGCQVKGQHGCQGLNECKGLGGCNPHCPAPDSATPAEHKTPA